MSFTVCIAVLLGIFIIPTQSTELCEEGKNYWYDIQDAKCRPCKECAPKSVKLEPCSDFADTWCIDFREIGMSIKTSLKSEQDERIPHKWHEMEGEDIVVLPDHEAEKMIPEKPFLSSKFDKVSVTMMCVCFLMFCICVCSLIMCWRYKGKGFFRSSQDIDHSSYFSRNRLFSRDRLNTTEYMKNLATLDRRLAMDEILEKRKRAIFEPQLLSENLYSDERFIDLSGLPRDLREGAQNSDPEHRRLLLRLQDNL